MEQMAEQPAQNLKPYRPWLPVWLRGRSLAPLVEAAAFALMVGVAAMTYFLVAGQDQSESLLTPPIVALLLVANLLPAIALLVLLGRRIARRRAAASPIGGDGQLHVRLVAIFSIIASVPMLLVVIFASLLFQYGVQFWFSDNARGLLQNAGDLARGYYQQNVREVGEETVTMASDLRNYLQETKLSSPNFAEGYIYQVVTRKLNQSSIIEIGKDGVARTAATVDPDRRPPADVVTPEIRRKLAAGLPVWVEAKADRIDAVALLDRANNTYLYASRSSDLTPFRNAEQAKKVLADYDDFSARSRQLQLQFNVLLFIGSLLLVGVAVVIALNVADRLVRPVGELVDAARRITAGDLSIRVPGPHARDEIGILAGTFNRMTQRLEAQTGALVAANSQLDNRRAFTEAVLSGVTAGVISVDRDGVVRLINRSALDILADDDADPVGHPLASLSSELAELLHGVDSAAIVQVNGRSGDIRTLAVKLVRESAGRVLTFDDITQQLSDQRRAAWADVARRIAHEIKNPLTPIQLAAERLQRRYGGEVTSDPSTFQRLTGTIVRQVGDLRRIVDEFSAFARMPKPVFRSEQIADIAKQALFLHEVAHPDIAFSFSSDIGGQELVCDRRQIGQALTNIVKNAVEAIEPKKEKGAARHQGHVRMALRRAAQGRVAIEVTDDGIGLPQERERIVEPYMTTRAKGTGLGLAIVSRIVEEHMGEMQFADADGGGTRVTILLDPAALERLDEDVRENRTKGMMIDHGA